MPTQDHHFRLNGDEPWLIRFTTLKGAAYGYTFSQKAKHPRIIPDVTFDGSTVNAPSLDFGVRPRQFPGTNYGNSDKSKRRDGCNS